MDTSLILAVADLSERYKHEYLDEQWCSKRQRLLSDWFDALKFFLEHVFYQGRNDSLSKRYCEKAWSVLESHFTGSSESRARSFTKAWDARWIPHEPIGKGSKPLAGPIAEALESERAGKRGDREMVMDTLRYIHGLPQLNVVRYSCDQVSHGGIPAHYEELQKIRQVGPKTASLYLRDLCFIYDLKPDPRDFVTTQPIDTWVRTISMRLGIITGSEVDLVVRERILEACRSAGVSPLDYNAGAWFLGKNSLTVALDQLASAGESKEF